MKTTDLHIGKNILSVMTQKGITKAELARMLDIKPQSVDYLLKRKSIDTDTLYTISVVLDFDFSKFYSIDQTIPKQTNFDIEPSKAKVVVEIDLNVEDIVKLNLKNKIVQVLG